MLPPWLRERTDGGRGFLQDVGPNLQNCTTASTSVRITNIDNI